MPENIIVMEGLTKKYGKFTAVDNLTLSIHPGEVFGLLGPNGAGKTTTTLMLLGLTEPTAGSAWINGVNCTREPIRIKRFVGYLPDNVGFYPDLTGRENLRITGRMNGVAEEKLEETMNRLLERVGMTEAADKRTGAYSKGMRQRLGIADILMKDPDVLIMDEPTNGIDPEGMRELMQLIRELAEKDGKTILISSHQLHQIQQICDRVGIFVQGKLIACGAIDELGQQLVEKTGFRVEVGTEPLSEKAFQILSGLENVDDVIRQEHCFLVQARANVTESIVRALFQAECPIVHLRQRSGDLDEIYAMYFEKAGENDDGGKRGKKH